MRCAVYPEYKVDRIHRDFDADGYHFVYTDHRRLFVSRTALENVMQEIVSDNITQCGAFLRHRADEKKYGRSWIRAYRHEMKVLTICPAS